MAYVYLTLFYILCVLVVGIYVGLLVTVCRKLSQQEKE